ncbi:MULTISPECIES: cytochrome d ubiquinol oxidase subunit II [Rhizobium/Agrobacterium group]|uniref:cytochrome d ubiquinol oxidase subunit II n=1 Tax=Rhizobium/Agrobacterium group TaxID=227290 RepID=UPI00107EF8DA|nr:MULTISPECIES: cytochrome d ubiquinol oxidase subunit II [Rhizobium/Agrobacterium group]MBB4404005.1 cytochrome d ubiquinol oxidase subunit II [Agrobacterium radiobacter]MBB5590157.1 cytochrome d ubiquinol oxidase subunit II [Agrobacterium radiobacter]TGE86976.1 cytochrome d ubiquinol oxidase subunit II [Rhizobium sp. SEMIA 4032]
MILHQLIDYEILRVIWWLLLGVVLIGFAVTGGFDLGTGALLPFVAKTDIERRVVINSIGPVWEGNQVWLILGGGAIFAAWPPLYAVSFSGFYLAMFATLFALILRPVGFKYRSKRESAAWRTGWDWALFIGGFVPALIFGVAIGNVLQGVPFHLNDDLRIFYDGTTLFELLNPYAILCGLVSVAMLIMHGAAWLVLKTDGPVAARARGFGSIAALATTVLFALGGVFLWLGIDGYRFTSEVVTDGPSNPLSKTVEVAGGVWFDNYAAHPWMMLAPALGLVFPLVAFVLLRARREVLALLSSSLAIFGIISTVGLTMFPFILPSSVDPKSSLTVWDASSSHMTLFIMLVVALIFIPIIVAYTSWVYRVLWGKVDEKAIRDDSGHAY